MKAIVQNGYGSSEVLKMKDVEKPKIKENEILIKVRAAGINAGDYFSMQGSPWLIRFSVGFPKPKDYIPGWDFCGCVEETGKSVDDIKSGDDVFGACNHTFAEYVVAKRDGMATKPANLGFKEAASVPTAALTALQGLRDIGKLQPGQKVLINGASGGVGTFAVQIAKALGAEVSGVCSSRNISMVQSIGADQVFDYTKEDFTRSGQRFDLILDNVANFSFSDLRRALSPQGVIIPNSGHGGTGYVFKAFALSPFLRQHARPWVANINSKDLVYLKELIESEKIQPVIDRSFPFEKAPEALGYAGAEHAQGKVVITFDE